MLLPVSTLVEFGGMIQTAYSTEFLADAHSVKSVGAWEVLDTLYANESGTPRQFGFILQRDNEITMVLRGTIYLIEWLDNARFLLLDYPGIPGAKSEAGFTALYRSLKTGTGRPWQTVVRPAGASVKLTIIGHSLGSSLATLAALEIGADALVTFASPKVGNRTFADAVQRAVRTIVALVNVRDAVPKVPWDIPLIEPYVPICDPQELDSSGLVADSILCWHAMATYLHLLDNSQPLSSSCLLTKTP